MSGTSETSKNGKWEEYSRLVLSELTRLDRCANSTKKDVVSLRVEIATLKVKSGVWGLVGAGISILLFLALDRLIGG